MVRHAKALRAKPWALCADILAQPHTLIAGTTGSGKSTFLRSILYSAVCSAPREKSLILIDHKRGIELGEWADIPHTIGFGISADESARLLDNAVLTMECRLEQLRQQRIKMWQGGDIYVIIDEIADLVMDDRTLIDRLARIGRLGRAARVHLIACTQNPSRNRASGGLPAELVQNVTSAVALRCRSAIESRQIIGIGGAELLPRYGKGIYWNCDGLRQVDIPFTPDEDVENMIKFWR